MSEHNVLGKINVFLIPPEKKLLNFSSFCSSYLPILFYLKIVFTGECWLEFAIWIFGSRFWSNFFLSIRLILVSELRFRLRLLAERFRNPSISWWLEMKVEFLFLLTFITVKIFKYQHQSQAGCWSRAKKVNYLWRKAVALFKIFRPRS